jgi:hypothetical protein
VEKKFLILQVLVWLYDTTIGRYLIKFSMQPLLGMGNSQIEEVTALAIAMVTSLSYFLSNPPEPYGPLSTHPTFIIGRARAREQETDRALIIDLFDRSVGRGPAW